MPKHRHASPSMASDGADGRISACRPHRTRARHDGRVRRGQDSPGTPRAHCRTHGSAGQRGIWLTAAVPLGDLAGPVVASLFGPLIAAFSVALYLLLASERATLAGQLAAVANVAAGALVTAMLLVQIAVDDVEATLTPTVHDAFKHVEFGLDLSWDVFLVAGTILFGSAMLADPRFGRRFGLPGIIVALALYAINFASFPMPPGDSGLVDLGPSVGLWYAAVSVQVLRLWRRDRTPRPQRWRQLSGSDRGGHPRT